MKNRFRRLLMCGTAAIVLMVNTMGVSAAELSDLFNAEYYAEQYPDVVAAYGTDESALYEHYINYGLKEGRNGSELFDVKIYRELYPDLEEKFGDDWEAYAEHYLTSGLEEGRDGGGAFDAATYADKYSDLKSAYGYDLEKLYEHYIVFGKAEGRDAESPTARERRMEKEAIVSAKLEAEFDALLEAYVTEYARYASNPKPNWKKLYRSAAYTEFMSYMSDFWDRVDAGEVSQAEARAVTQKIQQAFAEYVPR